MCESAQRTLDDCVINGPLETPLPEGNGKRKRYQKHRNNTSGVSGVSHDTNGKRYRAHWREGGKDRSKSFGYAKKRSKEGAFEAACAHRERMVEGKYND